MARTGRPTIYTAALVDEICRRLSEGESLKSVCRDEGMPPGATVWKWLREKPEFSAQYARAKEESAESYAEKITDIGDKVLAGEYEPAAARVAIDAFKWTSSKLKPKKYGERIHNEHSGSIDLSGKSDAELLAILKDG